jgi:hypothetical protein
MVYVNQGLACQLQFCYLFIIILFYFQEDNMFEGSFLDMIEEIVGLIWDNLLSRSCTCI